jgi:hypothetical protein
MGGPWKSSEGAREQARTPPTPPKTSTSQRLLLGDSGTHEDKKAIIPVPSIISLITYFRAAAPDLEGAGLVKSNISIFNLLSADYPEDLKMTRLSSTAISNSTHFLSFIFGWAPSILHRYQVEAKLKKTFCVMTFDHKLSPVSHFVASFQNSSLFTKLITPSEDCFKEDASSKYTSPSSLQ